jgi:hypothetical protein
MEHCWFRSRNVRAMRQPYLPKPADAHPLISGRERSMVADQRCPEYADNRLPLAAVPKPSCVAQYRGKGVEVRSLFKPAVFDPEAG